MWSSQYLSVLGFKTESSESSGLKRSLDRSYIGLSANSHALYSWYTLAGSRMSERLDRLNLNVPNFYKSSAYYDEKKKINKVK